MIIIKETDKCFVTLGFSWL